MRIILNFGWKKTKPQFSIEKPLKFNVCLKSHSNSIFEFTVTQALFLKSLKLDFVMENHFKPLFGWKLTQNQLLGWKVTRFSVQKSLKIDNRL